MSETSGRTLHEPDVWSSAGLRPGDLSDEAHIDAPTAAEAAGLTEEQEPRAA